MWNEPEFRYLWAGLAGFAALLSIVHAALQVPERLARHFDSKMEFSSLRIALETFRHQMQIFPNFEVKEYNERYLQYRERYQTLVSNLKSDVLSTGGMVTAAQLDLNETLRDLTSR